MSKIENLPSLAPRTFQDAMDFSKLLADSNFVPKDFKGKPGDILAAIQMGYEVGLSPMAALQNIAVINGRPSIWGDAALALVKASGLLAHHNEYWEPDGTAVCEVGRKGHLTPDGKQHITIVKFGKKDAQAAGLLGKQTYQQYQPRMFQFRARGFGLRDEFPDVLKGLITREEAMDYSVPASQTTITVIADETQPQPDPSHEARREERAVTTSGLEATADNLGEARSGNVTRAGQPEVVRSDDALIQAPASPRTDGEAEGQPSVGEQDGKPAPDAPADDNDKAMLGELYKAASKRIGSVAAFSHLREKGLWPYTDLPKSKVEACAEALQNL